MLAPTAPVPAGNSAVDEEQVVIDVSGASDALMTDSPAGDAPAAHTDVEGVPHFPPMKASAVSGTASLKKGALKSQTQKVPIPPHRMTPLRNVWHKLYPPLVEHLLLQVRMNTKSRAVELRESKATKDAGALQKGVDFVRAFALGFDIDDAIALLRLDDLYIDTFEIKDVKTLHGDHLSRAIGRIAGQAGKTKFAIENASRTRIVLADQKIHILGGYTNIRVAKDAVVSLILGTPPGKVYANLRNAAARAKERF
ncbi:RNA-binding protein Rbp28 [Schizosaccharomyces japonicus yFS275]|uniref:Pre-rRNA-processing protein PNO1 n=1 Tax=Schizosaccharomyces japonicus (strain yFS275 / FY16936) TaxID=402676 RepID=B6K5A2_SCHJY|nr:RNA-binding protein Rbp28 [Schizosaccharomyces japonicus yFS275]EEB08706.1 RNA-binding protein Rbp28 [Schizosaccharomyces japonicus yFS275]